MYKKERRKCLLSIAGCVLVFFLGQFLLNVVSKYEDPFLGNTFYIITGCALIVLSLIVIYLLILHLRYLRRREQKRKNSSLVFLAKEKRKNDPLPAK